MYFSSLLVNFVLKTMYSVPSSSLMLYLSLQASSAVIKRTNQEYFNYFFLHKRQNIENIYFLVFYCSFVVCFSCFVWGFFEVNSRVTLQ